MAKRKSYKPRSYWLDIKRGICPNCGQKGPHFVPPSLGDKGFFMCSPPKESIAREEYGHRGEATGKW